MTVGAGRPLPEASVIRLHHYRRVLSEFADAGMEVTSSEELARAVGVNPAQVRKDLSWLGSHGTRGVGYEVAQLRERLTEALGLDREWRIAIVGVGNLGRALATYAGLRESGFRVAALFDVDPELVGRELGGVTVHHADELDRVVAATGAEVAILAVPAAAAPQAAQRLADAGIAAILNFAPVYIESDGAVRVRRVDLSSELGVLVYHQHLGREPSLTDEAAGGSAR